MDIKDPFVHKIVQTSRNMAGFRKEGCIIMTIYRGNDSVTRQQWLYDNNGQNNHIDDNESYQKHIVMIVQITIKNTLKQSRSFVNNPKQNVNDNTNHGYYMWVWVKTNGTILG